MAYDSGKFLSPRSIKGTKETKPTLINSKLPPIAAAQALPTFPTMYPVNLNSVRNLFEVNWNTEGDRRISAALIPISLRHWSLDHNRLECHD